MSWRSERPLAFSGPEMTDTPPDPPSVSVAPLLPSDAAEAGELHRLAFPTDHFTQRFSRSTACAFYLHLAKSLEFAFVARQGGRLVGVLLGGIRAGDQVIAFAGRHPLRVASTFARNPEFLLPQMRSLLRRAQVGHQSSVELRLLDVVVAPDARRRGVSRSLIAAFEAAAMGAGATEYGASVKLNNAASRAMLESVGGRIEAQTESAVYYAVSLSPRGGRTTRR